MTRCRLLIISYSPLYRDARVLRQIRLFTADHDVTTVGYGPAPADVVEHIRIPDEIVYWHKDRRLLLARAYQRTYDTMPVQQWLRGRLPVGGHDVVIANDADTLPLAVGLRPRKGVHADLHEYAPSQREHVAWWRWIVAPYYRWLIRRWGTRADSVTTVSPGLVAEYRRVFGIEAGLVMNAAPFADLKPSATATPSRLVHSGIGVPERLEAMLAAVDLMRSGATLDLYLMDQGDGYLSRLREQYRNHPRVHVREPVATDRLASTLNAYDIGVYMQPPVTFNLEHALPNKLFDFVQARLGLVIGPSPDMAEIVREHRLGVVSPDFSAASFAATIDALTSDRVAELKAASDAAAPVLCAETQVGGWSDAIARLLEKP